MAHQGRGYQIVYETTTMQEVLSVRSGTGEGTGETEDRLPRLPHLRGPRRASGERRGGWESGMAEVWKITLPPTRRSLRWSLLVWGPSINRKDLRGTLKECTDEEIATALGHLVGHKLLVPAGSITNSGIRPGYEVQSAKEFED